MLFWNGACSAVEPPGILDTADASCIALFLIRLAPALTMAKALLQFAAPASASNISCVPQMPHSVSRL